MCYTHQYMLSRKFYRIDDNSSTFRLFNIYYNILIFAFSVIIVIHKNYTNPKFLQNVAPYSFGKVIIQPIQNFLELKKLLAITLHIMDNMQRLNWVKTDCHLLINRSVVFLRRTIFIFVKGNFMIKKNLKDAKYNYTLLCFIKMIKLHIDSKS